MSEFCLLTMHLKCQGRVEKYCPDKLHWYGNNAFQMNVH